MVRIHAGELSRNFRMSKSGQMLLDLAAEIAKKARGAGGNAYVVGGWCRDRFLGLQSMDLDMEWFGADRATVLEILCGFGHQVIVPPDSERVPYKIILGKEGYIDITLPLRKVRDFSGHDSYQVDRSLTPEAAALRRDFTCNAFYHDLCDGSWLDPFDGIGAIRSRELRLVPGIDGQSMDGTICLRGCRLSAQLGFSLDHFAKGAIREAVTRGCLDQIDPLLKTNELVKLLTRSPKPSEGLRLAESLGVLQSLFPEIAALKDVPQNPVHHPEGSAYEHTLLVVDAAAALSRDLPQDAAVKLMLAALFHDVGKLTTTKVRHEPDGDKISSPGHEQESVNIARRYFQGMTLSHQTQTHVKKLVANHMKPMELCRRAKDGQDTFDNLVRQLVRSVHPADFSVFLRLCRADQRGRKFPDTSEKESTLLGPIEDAIARNGFLERPTHRLMNGKSLRDLGFHEEEFDFGAMITEVESLRDKGKIRTTEEASKHLLIHFGMSSSGVSEQYLDTPGKKAQFYKTLRGEIIAGKLSTFGDMQQWARKWSV
jgi:tRNA nucleotidyltransferase (CCA-adding enzyme)